MQSEISDWQFKILYDGECPFCKLEINWLHRKDKFKKLEIVDIAAPEFDPAKYGSTIEVLMGTIHGVLPDGRMVTGMEAFRHAYRAAGVGWIMAPTGWPILKPLFDRFYRIFAANRVKIGEKFGRPCEGGRCKI